MPKIAGKLYLRPGMYQEYYNRHVHIWPEMKELLQQAGISNYTIWFDGIDLFEYFEIANEKLMWQVLAASPVKKRWDDYMSDIIIGRSPIMALAFEFN